MPNLYNIIEYKNVEIKSFTDNKSHASTKPGVYEIDEEHDIVDIDVKAAS